MEVRGSSGWGALCYDEKFEFDVGHAVCRETKEMFSYRMRNVSTRNYSGYRYKGSIKCGPSAVSLSECVLQLSSLPRCPNGELVVDCSAGKLKGLCASLQSVGMNPAERMERLKEG